MIILECLHSKGIIFSQKYQYIWQPKITSVFLNQFEFFNL